jgi:hypothetical protein
MIMTSMQRIAVIAIVWVCAMPGTSSAQSAWREFISKEDRFGANFPGEPVITQITWRSEHGASVPARVYTVTQGPSKYSMTVVDYNLVKNQLIERAKTCPPDTERCLGTTAFSGDGYWKNDLRGAMIYVAFQFLKRGLEVTHYMWNYLGQGVEVNELQFVNTRDQSRTFVSIYMHHNVLYVMEATAPGHYPPPGLFTQSIALYEADGTRANHGKVVFNGAELDPNEVYVGREGRGGAAQ